MILVMDWLSTFGPMMVDWCKGILNINSKGKTVKFQVEEVTAEIQIYQHELDITKKKKKGTQIIVAHLFSTEVMEASAKVTHPGLQQVLNEFSEVFASRLLQKSILFSLFFLLLSSLFFIETTVVVPP